MLRTDTADFGMPVDAKKQRVVAVATSQDSSASSDSDSDSDSYITLPEDSD